MRARPTTGQNDSGSSAMFTPPSPPTSTTFKYATPVRDRGPGILGGGSTTVNARWGFIQCRGCKTFSTGAAGARGVLATTDRAYKHAHSVAQVIGERTGAGGAGVDDNATTPSNVVEPPSARGSIVTQCNAGGDGTNAAPGCRCRQPSGGTWSRCAKLAPSTDGY